MDNLTLQFLVAMPQLHQTYFERAVILLIEHSDNGAMGLVLNKQPQIDTVELFGQLSLPAPKTTTLTISDGGPVSPDQGFILHQDIDATWSNTVQLCEQLCVTTSLDIVEAIANDKGPQQALIAVGYAGWESGQLESEIADNAWLTLPFDANIVMHTPQEQMLSNLTLQNGVRYNQLVSCSGHA